MVCVHRSGSSVSIPRRLSHHVPVVPIINWDPAEMERRETAEYQVLHCTVLYCTVLYCTVLYCVEVTTVLRYNYELSGLKCSV